jgi:hypothetical protein
LFAYTFNDLGISVGFVRDPDDLGERRGATINEYRRGA